MLAIIGGSGLAQLSTLAETRHIAARTAYGEPSGPLTLGRVGGREVLFLARHGEAHSVPPHQVNYRANIQALKDAGARRVASVASVGGIRREFGPGVLIVPDQIIDYTWGRASTFFEGPSAPVTHIDFTHPYSAGLRNAILAAARACGEAIADGGCYGATQGPRLETAAEINRYERDGADIVGMTVMPEASLARELDLPYAAICLVANWAAGRGDSAHAIRFGSIEQVLHDSLGRVRQVIEHLCTGI